MDDPQIEKKSNNSARDQINLSIYFITTPLKILLYYKTTKKNVRINKFNCQRLNNDIISGVSSKEERNRKKEAKMKERLW